MNIFIRILVGAIAGWLTGKAVEAEGRVKVVREGHGLDMIYGIVGAFIWLYQDTVNKTSLSSRIAALQTLATEEGKQMVLSVTLSDGNNVKYLIKLPQADKMETAEMTARDGVSKEKVSSWELERLGTALSIGDNPLPLGMALKIANQQ